jgi:hypothetical protein
MLLTVSMSPTDAYNAYAYSELLLILKIKLCCWNNTKVVETIQGHQLK